MRLSDFLFFLKQIFFPDRNPKGDPHPDFEEEPNRLVLFLESFWKRLRRGESVAVLVSLLLHAVVLVMLSLIFLPGRKTWEGIALYGGSLPPDVRSEDIGIQPGKPDPSEEKPQDSDAPSDKKEERIVPIEQQETPTPNEPDEPAPDPVPPDPQGVRPVGGTPEAVSGGLVSGGGYEGRTPEGRGRSVGTGETTVGGEDAVEAALAWFAAHQIRKKGSLQGSWSFDFEETCNKCSHGGSHGSRVAATALALLPFLGAGYTHEEGRYKEVVEDGLYFLLVRARETTRGAELNQGTEGMYSHGIATMALCEAYAMSRNKPQRLRHVAQEAIRFIEEAQDRRTGGWRYTPNESPGDLSVSAWQIMALKSARLAGLHVSEPTIYEAIHFLDSVQMEGGIKYNYLPDFDRRGSGEDSPWTCNATGLLLRQYFGWKPGYRTLDEGIDLVARHGPLKNDGRFCNLYYAYYATLALHHHDGSGRRKWNDRLREFLVRTQSRRGDEAGSWFFPDHYCDKGGRLLNTALATLILETPYRIMPLFRNEGQP